MALYLVKLVHLITWDLDIYMIRIMNYLDPSTVLNRGRIDILSELCMKSHKQGILYTWEDYGTICAVVNQLWA